MRPREHLLKVSGYAGRPKDFEVLLRMLDGELRLITPTDPEGGGLDVGAGDSSPGRFYQLTHDYLVPAFRDWLTRKQKETRRGRAELRLAERAGLWQVKHEKRHLPAFWEWANIRMFTRKQDWTLSQKSMMRAGAGYFGLRGAAWGLLLAVVAVAGWVVVDNLGTQRKEAHATALLERLRVADTAQVPAIVKEIGDYRHWIGDKLQEEFNSPDSDPKQKLHASLALLPVDNGQADYLGAQFARRRAAGGPGSSGQLWRRTKGR